MHCGGDARILLLVKFYRSSQMDTRFTGGVLVQSGAVRGGTLAEELIDPSEVIKQVFYATDPEKPNFRHVFSLLPRT